MSARTRPAGHPVVALTVAGSDPSGGAGIQADLKTFAALGAYGCAVLTGLTAQSTVGVREVAAVPGAMVAAQLETLLDDIAVDAVKIGMTSNAEVARAIAAALGGPTGTGAPVVLDPVMVATSGDRLLDREAEHVLRTDLLPLADLVTPNLAEAAVLLGREPARTAAEAADQATALLDLGPTWALVKGGHLPGAEAVDHLAGPGGERHALASPRVVTNSTHGTGCTLSSACAALRPTYAGAGGWPATVRAAKDYLHAALSAADDLVIGGTGHDPGPYRGHGPVQHAVRTGRPAPRRARA
ncbi:bifunctional hydroxymethylpyrimidine kinase/phosphomethylpyrimidine kinase [Nocardioides litoris]|uniref:bifunctional hydroxymethylpyrimidine kinase/phosphomethylpyrimidine kinase n=1 Tax=Nocardioides litoris TaxID=1926648 RepID=UPI001FE37EBB|nr:bifunctional hydroxymethylpyrimidine kinase/phosphomethylpyrimidine kinase [Nocardioides litoris]